MAKSKRMSGKYPFEEFKDERGLTVSCRCVFCGKIKDIDEFAKNGKDKYGKEARRRGCKQCYNIRRRDNKTSGRHTSFLAGQRRRGDEVTDISFSHRDWKECLIFFEGACAFCGSTPRKGQRLTRDHLVPVSKGGRTIQSNIVPACSKCNSSKGAKDFKDWFMAQPFFSQDRLNRIFKWRTIIRQTESTSYVACKKEV